MLTLDKMSRTRVSLLVAMRNEEGYIAPCLASILAQDYPAEDLEVWVLDGHSTDDSWQIADRLFSGRAHCHVVSNPGITQSSGWNIGIERATGDVIGIVSAHSELAPDYVSTAVATLRQTGADLVGGPMKAVSATLPGRAVASATSTPFGVGGARFHYATRQEEVDTVYMGLCWREMYDRMGGFDPEMIRNQDDELSYRLLKDGGRIVCNPKIRSCYHNRASFRSLWRQYFQYGFYKVRVMQKHPRQMRLRQFIPGIFVATLLLCFLLAFLMLAGKWILLSVAGAYVVANLGASSLAARKDGWRLFPLLPIMYATIHFAYGTGFLIGLVKFWNRWGQQPQLIRPKTRIQGIDRF